MSDYTKVSLPSVEDMAPGYGVEVQTFRGVRDALGCERSGLSFQELKPGARQPFGHAHREEEEIYVVVSGSGRMRVGADEIELGALDAVRVAPAAMRGMEAGPDGLAFLAFGAPGGGASDGEMKPGWWGDEAG